MRLCVCALLLPLLTLLLQASEPQDALRYHSRVTDSLAAQVTLAKAVWEATRKGLSGSIEGNRVSKAFGSTLCINWKAQTLATLEAYQGWETRIEGLRNARNSDCYDALMAYTALREAELAVSSADVRLQMSTLAKADMERKQIVGTVTALDVALQHAGWETDTQLAQLATQQLAMAQRLANEFDLHVPTAPSVVRFRVADVPIEQLFAWKQLQRDVVRQQVVVRDTRRTQGVGMELGLTDITTDYQVTAKLSSRTPGSTLVIGYPSQYDPTTLVLPTGTDIFFRVNYVLDPAARANLRLEQATQHTMEERMALQRQQMDLTQQQAQLQMQMCQAREEESARAVDLAQQVYQQRQQQFAAGLVSQQAMLQQQLHLLDAQQTANNTWKRYIGAVYDILTLNGGDWEISK